MFSYGIRDAKMRPSMTRCRWSRGDYMRPSVIEWISGHVTSDEGLNYTDEIKTG